jgi:elongation factor G
MDFMDLEREKGITIQSAATFCKWGDTQINIIDTPGHVDFTIEVERALRVLDGAVLVMCGVAGIQSQTITVDRQMRRYNVPRIVFINKLDRMGADPWKVAAQVKSKLNLNAAALQIPIGLESNLAGVVDLVAMKPIYFEGKSGDAMRIEDSIPPELQSTVQKKRQELLERLADADDQIAEHVMEGTEPTPTELREAIRRATISHRFVPIMMGSALKNTGIQLLLDGITHYLPNPMESRNVALDTTKGEAQVDLQSDTKKPFIG